MIRCVALVRDGVDINRSTDIEDRAYPVRRAKSGSHTATPAKHIHNPNWTRRGIFCVGPIVGHLG